MKNLNIKPFIYLILIFSGVFWFSVAYIRGLNLSDVFDFFKVLPTVAIIDGVLIAIFIKWGWKLWIFKNWLVPFPDLNGTWEGTIKTTWIDPKTGQTPAPIPAILTIKQTFTKISCVMRTAEMTSYSFSEDFKLESDNQLKQLSYSYTSKPLTTISDRSPVHDGSIVFEIIGDPVQKLKGQYWTARKTTGEIIMTFRCKERLDEYPQELGSHPVGEQYSNRG
jgi:hypothetical protein